MNQETICQAIAGRNTIRFHYNLDAEPGFRTVEPHMVAYNEANHLVLSAWFLRGSSESKKGQGWREYLLSEISSVTILPEQFSGARPGYVATGGKKFHNLQCAL